MNGFLRRVRDERNLWKAVWQQVETFLDRVQGAADQDTPYVATMCALLSVFSVIERARVRAVGYGLASALPASPRGDGRGDCSASSLTPPPAARARLPGVEETEYAVAAIVPRDGENALPADPDVVLWPTQTLASFRDDKRDADVTLRVPAYDLGRLVGVARLAGVVNAGMFSKASRQDAVDGNQFSFKAWSAIRADRVAARHAAADPDKDIPILAAFDKLAGGATLDRYQAIGQRAHAAASACHDDRNTLDRARGELEAAGVDQAVLDALAASMTTLNAQATDYSWVASRLTPPALASAAGQLGEIRARLVTAERPDGAGLPRAITALDTAAAAAMDVAAEARIAYPDGPLRMLRMLEQSLRMFWIVRARWMDRRHQILTRPLLASWFAPFVDSLTRALAGQPSGLVLGGDTRLAAQARYGARELALDVALPRGSWPLGRLAFLGGARPTAAVVVDSVRERTRLVIPPLAASLEVEPGLRGLPGVIEGGAPVLASIAAPTADELRTARSRSGAEANALIEALVAHGSRLLLVLGGAASNKDRPTPPEIKPPYPGMRFEVTAPVTPDAARLFLAAMPPASASGTGARIPIARRGELLLLRGADHDNQYWQGVVEVDRCVEATGAQARSEDAATATPTPPCCADQDPVMIVYLRSMMMPATLARDVTLHREFRGFGLRSLLAGSVLPEQLDHQTETIQISEGGTQRTVLRDPELRAALRVLDDWLGSDTGGPA